MLLITINYIIISIFNKINKKKKEVNIKINNLNKKK